MPPGHSAPDSIDLETISIGGCSHPPCGPIAHSCNHRKKLMNVNDQSAIKRIQSREIAIELTEAELEQVSGAGRMSTKEIVYRNRKLQVACDINSSL